MSFHATYLYQDKHSTPRVGATLEGYDQCIPDRSELGHAPMHNHHRWTWWGDHWQEEYLHIDEKGGGGFHYKTTWGLVVVKGR